MTDRVLADIDAAVAIVRAARTFPWTWRPGDIGRFGAMVGWTEPRETASGVWMRSNSQIPESYSRFRIIDGVVVEVNFQLAEIPEASARDRLLTVFHDAAHRFEDRLGVAAERVFGDNPKSWWRTDRVVVELAALDVMVKVTLREPEALATDTQWRVFTEALSRTLADLVPGAKLIIRDRAKRFVQFARDDDQLDSEVVGNRYLDPPLDSAVQQLIESAGWAGPLDEIDDSGNWHRMLPVPIASDSYLDLAQATERILRHAFAVGAPAELNAEGWVDGPGFIDLSELVPIIGEVREEDQ
ncbi:hypothetical protein D5S18_17155 [Nocardia panacis]|uniref:TY-Chap N-terminal domain-containing protein n=1 Tax=Nocardia panacis TaxID=2340916 RepID=A0A3A4K472_9NOCA|nr:DUF6301 family protein [Nocardia panacis]RJO75103.1 hypothetical protein D5S18_17155 [Nocardia panacis]